MNKRKRKRSAKERNFIYILAVLIATAVLFYYVEFFMAENERVTEPDSRAKAHFIDVGQGDSILLSSGRFNVLVDSGEESYSEKVIEYIKGQGIKRLDAIVATHPHSDHIGGLDMVIRAFEVGEVYMPDATNNTRQFEQLLSAIEEAGLRITVPDAGDVISGGDVRLTFLTPIGAGDTGSRETDGTDMDYYTGNRRVVGTDIADGIGGREADSVSRGNGSVSSEADGVGFVGGPGGSEADGASRGNGSASRGANGADRDESPASRGTNGAANLNNASLVIRVQMGGGTLLLTGDAEKEAEREILESGADITCDVLKVAHHGSSTSTGSELLEKAAPGYAVISLGADNKYGHPHTETMKLLNDAGVKVYRTDEDGTIVFAMDGGKIDVASHVSR